MAEIEFAGAEGRGTEPNQPAAAVAASVVAAAAASSSTAVAVEEARPVDTVADPST